MPKSWLLNEAQPTRQTQQILGSARASVGSMIWLVALLLAGIFGLTGRGWWAPVAIALAAAVIIVIDGVAANEFTPASVGTLALVIAATFLVWGAGRALRRFFSTAD